MAIGMRLALKFMVKKDISGIITLIEILMCTYGTIKEEWKTKLVLELDLDADIIEVPQYVINNRELLQNRFYKWLYSSQSKHKYRIKMQDSSGKTFMGVRYRSDAFVEWLNKSVLADAPEKACIFKEHALDYSASLPKLQFWKTVILV